MICGPRWCRTCPSGKRPTPPPTCAASWPTGNEEAFFQRGNLSVLFYLAPLRGRGDEAIGAMEIVRLASVIDRRLREARSDVVIRLSIRLSILLAVIVVATALVMQRQVLRPVGRLLAGIEAVGRAHLPPAVPVTHHDELGRVAEAFNQMAGRLDAAQGRLLELEQQLGRAAALSMAGKLTSALAHEVGTPLNIISARAERQEDIMLLAPHFLERAAKAAGKEIESFDEESSAWLLQHRWPGNVRELENVVERAATLARGRVITLADLHIAFAPDGVGAAGVRPTLSELQSTYIRRVIEETNNNKQAAARILGVSVRTLQRHFR